jgi:hypothetical protein
VKRTSDYALLLFELKRNLKIKEKSSVCEREACKSVSTCLDIDQEACAKVHLFLGKKPQSQARTLKLLVSATATNAPA